METGPDRQAVSDEFRYERLTWPEMNLAVEQQKVIVLPIGAIEQHGHHLPLDVDVRLASSVALEAGRRAGGELLVMPAIDYGYCHHVMDFPGTINIQPSTFVNLLLDITRSVAYHGFRNIILINGHGSNYHLVEQAGRQTNLQTSAVCCTLSWWHLIARYWNAEVRESGAGGCGHACELETSMYLHLDPDGVRRDRIKDAKPKFSLDGGSVADQWQWVDLTLGSGPATIVDWSSAYGDTGAFGAPELATEEKGRLVFDHAVEQLVAMARWLKDRPEDIRQDFRAHPSTTKLDFGF
jgi:creatinine amidohydrolase